jgi:serine/threonine protein kinase
MLLNNKELKDLVGSDINKYTITKYISSGSFGNVFEAKNKKTGELVALKIPIINEERDGQKSILDEARIYKQIASPENGVANMKIMQSMDKKIIVMDLLGESLEILMMQYKKFSIKTVIGLAIQMIDIIRYIHSRGYIHRDIKPDNFVIGYNTKHKLYCIDFGLAKRYINKNGDHISYCENKKFCGTARYASIAAHKNVEQSRKDDLESIAYILIYLYKGKLPWQGVRNKDKRERYRLIGEKKEKCTEEELCDGMPKQFYVFLKYIRNLDFDEKPHYSALKNMFVKLNDSKNYKTNNFDWE